jgi:predicted nucleic acid-binding protein
MRFLDTDILLYSISRDPAEAQKRERAIVLIEEGNNALSVQVLQEFYVQATRPTRADALPHDLAVGLMRTWLRFPIQEITLAVLSGALSIRAAFGLSYWDAAIVAAAEAMGCDEIASEDMTHGQRINDVTIRNPF